MPQRMVLRHALPSIALVLATTGSHAYEPKDLYVELSGEMAVSARWYPAGGAHEQQTTRHASGVIIEPEFYFEDEDGWSFTFTPYYRYDSADDRRTHADIREAYFLMFGEIGERDAWELRIGVDRVFWGVIEANHLVDIINQVDLIEHPDEEEELGQLMVHGTWTGDWGAAEFFVLPHHRERTFAGEDGRLRTSLPIDQGPVTYESSARQWHTDFALRYSHSFGPFDIGISFFDGTSREALLRPVDRNRKPLARLPDPALGDRLLPHYEQIRQFGLDAQMTTDAWLLKLEAIHRAGAKNLFLQEQDFAAVAAGVEYTFFSVFDSDADLGILGEWNYDERGAAATRVFNDDVFIAARYALNDVQDTNLLIGVLQDRHYSTRLLVIEFERRLTDQWSLDFETFAFFDVAEEDRQVYDTRRDTFVELRLSYHF